MSRSLRPPRSGVWVASLVLTLVACVIFPALPVAAGGGLPSPTVLPPYGGATATVGLNFPAIAFHCANISYTSGPTVSGRSGIGLLGMEGSTRSCAAGSTVAWMDTVFTWTIPFNATGANLSPAATIQVLYSAAYNVSLGTCGSPRVPAVSFCESGAIFQATYQVSVEDLTTHTSASGPVTNSPGIGHLAYVYCHATCNFTSSGNASGALRGYFFTDSGVHWNGVNSSDPFALEVTVHVIEQCFAESGYVHRAHAQAAGNFQVHVVSVSGI